MASAPSTAWLARSLGRPGPQLRADVALVVLNTPLPIEAMRSAWHSPCVAIRVAADGGANRLAAAAPELLPDVVVGDFGPSWA
jgi:hypothetical protein